MLLKNQYNVYRKYIKKENKWNMTSIIFKTHLGYIKISPFSLRCSYSTVIFIHDYRYIFCVKIQKREAIA